MAVCGLSALLMAVVMTSAGADTFLAAQPRVSTAHVRQSLWAELGSRSNPKRIAQLENELRPMYTALPKGEHGNIEHAVVRYAAHRYFVHRHGWHMKGLEPYATAQNVSSSATIKADMVPSYIQDIFEEYLGKRGFTLQDLAIYMATLEDLVSEDRLNEFLQAYRMLDFPTEESLPPSKIDEVLTTYMSSYILGADLSTGTMAGQSSMDLEAIYPGWGDTVTWVTDVRQTVEFVDRHQRNPFVTASMDIKQAELVMDDIGDRYGAFQDLECRALKDALVSMEYQDSGRVYLKDFYGKGLGGEWQFTESISYLRQLGALDETDPKRPSVVIPNYVAGQSNCLVSTGFYTVCCMDECDGLMHHLERKIATPLADVSEITAVISALPSATVHAPRNLSEDLLQRLEEIANHHGGLIPIHGRLFQQFMHHAYPRECVYPIVPGSTTPMSQEDWKDTFGLDSMVVSDAEKSMVASAHNDSQVWVATDALPWSEVEELVAQHKHGIPSRLSSTKSYVRACVLAVLAVSIALHLSSWAKSLSQSSQSSCGKTKDHFV